MGVISEVIGEVQDWEEGEAEPLHLPEYHFCVNLIDKLLLKK